MDEQPRIAIYTVIYDTCGYDDCQQDKNPFCSDHTFYALLLRKGKAARRFRTITIVKIYFRERILLKDTGVIPR